MNHGLWPGMDGSKSCGAGAGFIITSKLGILE